MVLASGKATVELRLSLGILVWQVDLLYVSGLMIVSFPPATPWRRPSSVPVPPQRPQRRNASAGPRWTVKAKLVVEQVQRTRRRVTTQWCPELKIWKFVKSTRDEWFLQRNGVLHGTLWTLDTLWRDTGDWEKPNSNSKCFFCDETG